MQKHADMLSFSTHLSVAAKDMHPRTVAGTDTDGLHSLQVNAVQVFENIDYSFKVVAKEPETRSSYAKTGLGP